MLWSRKQLALANWCALTDHSIDAVGDLLGLSPRCVRVIQAFSFQLTGIVGILAGLFVLRHPLVAALTVPTLIIIILGVQGLIMGVLEIIGGLKGGGIGS